VANQTILVGGRPFFPVMMIDQCTPAQMANARRLGVNLVLNDRCDGLSSRRQLTASRVGPYVVLPIADRAAGGARLVGWTYPDEPDRNGWTPTSLRAAYPIRRGTPDGLLSFVTTTGTFVPGMGDPGTPPQLVGRFARLADVAGFDLYPLNHCRTDLSTVAAAQRTFARLAGPTPTFQWIETGPIVPSYCGGFAMTPEELGAETWLAITGGARGIGFFTHTWSPAHSSFDVSPALQGAIRRTSAAIRSLRPGLTGTTVRSVANSPAISVLARTGGGATYVFAVNASRGPVKAELHVPSLVDGRAGLYGESRSVAVRGGRLVDMFPPLGIHIYVQRR
jgi:hypothetical protein